MKIKTGFVLLLLVTISVFALTSKEESSVRVGVILPLTGQYAGLGESDKNALEMAKEDLELHDIEIYFEDDAYDAKKAISAYQSLKSIHNIDAVIVLSAPSIQSLKPLTDKDGIPLLGLGGTLVYEKDSVFQIMPSGDTLFVKLGELHANKFKHIAIAHSNAALFSLNAESFIRGLGGKVRYSDIVLSDSTDYRTEIQKILDTKPDAVTAFMPKAEALKFLKALRIQDSEKHVKVICDFGFELAPVEYAEAIGQDRLEGCLSTNLADTATGGFKDRYKKRFGSDPMITADYAYDSLGIIKALIQSKPTNDWIKTLAAQDFEYNGYASGKIEFNDDGTRFDIAPEVHTYKNGKFVPVEQALY